MSSSRQPDAAQWLTEALATRDLDRLKPNMAAGGERINDARRHIRSARSLADRDATLAISACHDAIRKAITGHMAASGYRPRPGEGAHRVVLDYARTQLAAVIDAGDLTDADAIRKDRGLAEYGDFATSSITADHVRWAADVANRIIDAIAADLASRAPKRNG